MENNKYKGLGLEKDIVDTLEHIDDLEGVFWDFKEKIDAKQLISLYDNYLEITGCSEQKSIEIISKRNDFLTYLSKVNGEQPKFFDYLHKKWGK
jgi:hypothetical protein